MIEDAANDKTPENAKDITKNERDNEIVASKLIDIGRELSKETLDIQNSFRNRATAVIALNGAFITFFMKDFSFKYNFSEIRHTIPFLYFCTLLGAFVSLIFTFIFSLKVVLPQALPHINENILKGENYLGDSNFQVFNKIVKDFYDVVGYRVKSNEKKSKNLKNAYLFMMLSFIFGIVNILLKGV